jgi:hypothetical protein
MSTPVGIAIEFSARLEKNQENAKTDIVCCVCGKDVSPTKARSAHMHKGGSVFVTEAEAAQLGEGGDMGLQFIGPDCAKRHGLTPDHLHAPEGI